MRRREPSPDRLSRDGVQTICDRLVNEVGGYLRNVIREPAVTCAVCVGPVVPPYVKCHRCHTDWGRFGDQLADLVVPVCYGIKGTQSGHLMWMYKHPTAPVRRNRTLLTMLLLAALGLHERCIQGVLGHPIDAWAVVPSTRGRQGEHPLRVVARGARFSCPEIGLSINPSSEADDRATASDRFTVDDPSLVDAKNVLLIDDTWASGAHSQSAAMACKEAGAGTVTILVLARWLNPHEGPVTAAFTAAKVSGPYDPYLCPVPGQPCSI